MNSLVHNSSFAQIITAPYLYQDALFYRPVVNLSFILPVIAVNDSVTYQYLVNIIIHGINAFLLFVLLTRLKVNTSVSFWLSFLFVIHPVCTNAIAWLPGRNDALLMTFIMLSVIYYDRYLEKGNVQDLLLNILFFLLSLFTKETAVAAIFIYLIFYFIRRQKKFFPLTYSVPAWVIAALIWYLVRNGLIKEQAQLEYFRNLPFIIQAFGKAVFPFNLSVLPAINDTTFIYGIAAIIILTAIIYIIRKQVNLLTIFGLSWFVIFLIPPLFNINPEYNQNLMLESRLYLPFAGIVIFFSQIKIFAGFKTKAIVAAVSVVFAAACLLSIKYSSNYKDELTFWHNAVDNSPSLDLSYSGLGLVNLQRGNFQIAAENYQQAVILNPKKTVNNKQAGYCFLNLQKSTEAEKYFRNELELNPEDYDSNLLTGIICFKTGKPDESEKLLLKAYSLNKSDYQPVLYLLKLYTQNKNYQEAYKFADILRSKGFKIPDDIGKELNIH